MEKLISLRELAEALGISYKTMQVWCGNYRLQPYVRPNAANPPGASRAYNKSYDFAVNNQSVRVLAKYIRGKELRNPGIADRFNEFMRRKNDKSNL